VLAFFPHEGPGLVGLDLLGLDAADLTVMEQLGVLTRALGEARDGVEADLTQPRRRTGAGAVGEVLGDGDRFSGGVRRLKSGVLARSEKSWPQVAQRKQRRR
jgi:hypothetical protein